MYQIVSFHSCDGCDNKRKLAFPYVSSGSPSSDPVHIGEPYIATISAQSSS